MAVAWLRTTFLFVRALKDPNKYGIRLADNHRMDPYMRRSKVEQYLFGIFTWVV